MFRPTILADMTILIVEDHTEARFYLTQFLNQQGAKVIASADAFGGLQAVREHRPDVILSDISMPNRDGFEFCEKFVSSEQKTVGAYLSSQ